MQIVQAENVFYHIQSEWKMASLRAVTEGIIQVITACCLTCYSQMPITKRRIFDKTTYYVLKVLLLKGKPLKLTTLIL